jgi:hypothetical protein
VASLEAPSELAPEPVQESGPSVREFLAWIAARRPGDQPAAESASSLPPVADDFSAVEAPPPPAPSAVRRATPPEGRGGSIDALFGARTAGGTEDSAASALAQAFGGAELPSVAGRPARAAAGELSLDSVFRDARGGGAPRSGQSFSFDQFFSETAAVPARSTPPAPTPAPAEAHAVGEPPERSAEDIEQFNSWLQGLKPR